MRPGRAQRPFEQERPQTLALNGWNQPEMNELDGWLPDIIEFARPAASPPTRST
jgi:hypothetical protein